MVRAGLLQIGNWCCRGLILLILVGCARPPVSPVFTMAALPAVAADTDTSQDSWWACRFKIAWPEGADLDLSVDLLLAHRLVGPVLAQHSKDLKWWRFHRRAARDRTGHQFTFMFYADSMVAAGIRDRLQESPLLAHAMDAGLLEACHLPAPANPARDQVADTSDPNWSPELQRNWPAFIMGVSALWLGLIDDLARQTSLDDPADLKVLQAYYRNIDERLTAIYYQEGQHALLHHLNAVFGYEPMRILKELRF